MNKNSEINRRTFLQLLGISGLALFDSSKSFSCPEPTAQESREEQIMRIYNSIPGSAGDACQIPGVGRIDRHYVENSRHLLILINQEKLYSHGLPSISHLDNLMPRLAERHLHIKQVQNEVKNILSYLVAHDSESGPYFPRESDDRKLVYAQGLSLLSILHSWKYSLRDLVCTEMRRGIPIPNSASKNLDQIQNYIKCTREEDIMAAHLLSREANFSVQNIFSLHPILNEFDFDEPVITAIYCPYSQSEVRFHSNNFGNKFSLIEIIPATIAQEQASRSYK